MTDAALKKVKKQDIIYFMDDFERKIGGRKYKF